MPPTDIVQKLRNYLYDEQFVQPEFERAFEMAKKTASELFEEFKIETVDDYLDFYDRLVKWVPYEKPEATAKPGDDKKDGTFVYNSLCMFYFVLNQDPLSGTQSATRPTTHSPYTWLSRWIIDYAKEMGKWMDTTASINKGTIDTFYKMDNYHMEDYDRPRDDWQTFNEFFARRFKPGRRPIASPEDDTVIVSPADAKYDSAINVDPLGVCHIKGIPWSIKQLLDENRHSFVGDSFAGGKFCHSFLGPSDYHRIHAPVSGSVVEATVIEGLCYLEVIYRPESGSLQMCRSMDVTDPISLGAPNNAGYQFIQARALILLETKQLGLVAVLSTLR